MKRGELYVGAPPGEYGKPRPVVIVQSNLFIEERDSVTVCLLSSESIEAPFFRVPVERSESNRLKRTCYVMVDKLHTLRKERLRQPLGSLSPDELAAVDLALRRWLAL
ncbi:MAG: type II toxin-antitoxin system PemK/MazF family toxin [Burkholderiales bacterium]